jgi:hypothetical protein
MPIPPNKASVRIDDWIKKHWTKPCPFCGAKKQWSAWGAFDLHEAMGPVTTEEDKAERRRYLEQKDYGFGRSMPVTLVICQKCAAAVPLSLGVLGWPWADGAEPA